MGFLDNVKKGLSDVADSVSSAVNNTTSSAPPPPGSAPSAAGGPPGPPAQDDFIDATAPATWFPVPGDLELVIGERLGQAVTFGPPQTFDAEDAVTARWTSADGRFTVDVASIKEATLLRYGAQQALVDAYRGSIPGSRVNQIGDIGVTGAPNPGQVRVLSCVADMAARVDLYGSPEVSPTDLERTAEAIVRAALHLDG